MFHDEYATCKATYATLRVYPGELGPDEVTRILGIEPTSLQKRKEVRNSLSNTQDLVKLNGWFLSSKDQIESPDVRRHIDWIIDQSKNSKDAFQQLRDAGVRMDVSCYWLSAFGHGGPSLSPFQIHKLAELGLDCWFDVYFSDRDGENLPSTKGQKT